MSGCFHASGMSEPDLSPAKPSARTDADRLTAAPAVAVVAAGRREFSDSVRVSVAEFLRSAAASRQNNVLPALVAIDECTAPGAELVADRADLSEIALDLLEGIGARILNHHPFLWTIDDDEAACLVDVLLRMGLSEVINVPTHSNALRHLVSSAPIMHALLNVPQGRSKLDVNAPYHASVLNTALSTLAHPRCPHAAPHLCIRMLRLLRPQVLRKFDHLGALLVDLFSAPEQTGPIPALCVVRECIALAGPGGDGIDLTSPCNYGSYGTPPRMSMTPSLSGLRGVTPLGMLDSMIEQRACARRNHLGRTGMQHHLDASAEAFLSLRRDLVQKLKRIARYRRGGVQSAIGEALRTTSLYQKPIHNLIARLLIVPLKRETALDAK
jgi:hypothetical protein